MDQVCTNAACRPLEASLRDSNGAVYETNMDGMGYMFDAAKKGMLAVRQRRCVVRSRHTMSHCPTFIRHCNNNAPTETVV